MEAKCLSSFPKIEKKLSLLNRWFPVAISLVSLALLCIFLSRVKHLNSTFDSVCIIMIFLQVVSLLIKLIAISFRKRILRIVAGFEFFFYLLAPYYIPDFSIFGILLICLLIIDNVAFFSTHVLIFLTILQGLVITPIFSTFSFPSFNLNTANQDFFIKIFSFALLFISVLFSIFVSLNLKNAQEYRERHKRSLFYAATMEEIMMENPTASNNGNVILSVDHLYKTYPGVIALNDICFSLERGEIHALMGENGAGKSTLIKVIAGSIAPDKGTFTIDGHTFSRITPHQSKEMGVEVIYQELNLIPDLSVAENVFMGRYIGNGFLVNMPAMVRETKKIFEELEINIDPQKKVKELSMAQMQLVEITKAISHDAKILIMDEPTAPLTSRDVQKLFTLVRRLKDKGVTIIYISHRIPEVYELSDRITIMRDGHVITTKETSQMSEAELIKTMVGRELNETYPAREHNLGDVVLQVKGLCGSGVKDIDFDLHKGEILGVAGLIGAGRTETARMIFGADKKEKGEIWLEGKQVKIRNPHDAVSHGIALLPEDRKLHGVLLELSIRENIALPIEKTISKALVVNQKKENNIVEHYSQRLKIKTPSLNQLVRNLSGGNQQKVVMSKWLASEPRILIFDEPTRGIDVGAKYEIYQIMNELTKQGISIIMISSEMEELLGMADPDDIRDASNASLSNLTIGLYGYGGIARKVAKRLVRGFGSRVLAYDPFTPRDVMIEDGVEPKSADDLLHEADIVSLHVKLLPETKGMFGKAQFDKMKPTAIFINTARGELVNQGDLVEALKNGVIRSAGLDVFANEPIDPNDPLLKLPNVTATPHMAGVTVDIVPNSLSIMAEELRRFVNNQPLRFTVK